MWNVQDRRGGDRGSRPWIVRWAVDGRQRSRAFQTKSEAEGFRSELLLAKRLQEPFDPGTAGAGSLGTVTAVHSDAPLGASMAR